MKATRPGTRCRPVVCAGASGSKGSTPNSCKRARLPVHPRVAPRPTDPRRSERNPGARFTRELGDLVARELKAAGWRLGEVTTDSGSEFRAREFGQAVAGLGARQRRIKAGRLDSNSCVERLSRRSSRSAGGRPAFARSLAPKTTALKSGLDEYLDYFNYDRAHTGRLTQGRVPGDIVFGARKTRSAR